MAIYQVHFGRLFSCSSLNPEFTVHTPQWRNSRQRNIFFPDVRFRRIFITIINEVSDTSAVKYRFELKNEEKCYLIEYEIEEGIITLPLYMVAFFDI